MVTDNKNEVKTTAENDECDHIIVLTSDGGTRPNPGYGGWGMHGYLAAVRKPKKSSGNQTHILTTEGYIPKVGMDPAKHQEVTPIHYIDGYGSFSESISNNVAELVAAIQGLTYAASYQVKSVLIYTDSEYVCKGLESWVVGWMRNGWLKSDATEPANIEYWKQLVEAKKVLQDRGVAVKFKWVAGHAGHLGNEMADHLATVGVMASSRSMIVNSIESTIAEGYWKYNADKHPFLSNSRMYFNTTPSDLIPGTYFLGEHGNDDEIFGKRISDGAYAVIQLPQPDPILELVRSYQSEVAQQADAIVMARMDHIYRAETHRELSKHGVLAMTRAKSYLLDLCCLDKEPLTKAFTPVRIAMRAVDAINDMVGRLKQFQRPDDEELVKTDLTNILYETTSKTDKKDVVTTSMKLKDEYNVGYAALKVEANYETKEGIKSAPVILTLGIDMLDRNALKRLEEHQPKVTLVTWLDAPGVFRYATIIEASGAIGCWCGYYSNLRIVASETNIALSALAST